jgi:hypothetical protein
MPEKQLKKTRRITCESNENLSSIKSIVIELAAFNFPAICDVDVQQYTYETGNDTIVLCYLNRKMLLDGTFSRKDYHRFMDDTIQKIFSEMGVVVSINTLTGNC